MITAASVIDCSSRHDVSRRRRRPPGRARLRQVTTRLRVNYAYCTAVLCVSSDRVVNTGKLAPALPVRILADTLQVRAIQVALRGGAEGLVHSRGEETDRSMTSSGTRM